jgi:Patatin-like phospholipase
MKSISLVPLLTTLALSVLLQACRTLPRLDAVPPNLTEQAVIPGIPNARFWLDRDLNPFIQSVVQDFKREQDTFGNTNDSSNALPPIYMLAISGGGDDGPFAAGLLAGWSVHGDRPQFKVVTGISAGALIAPFAFLGSQYDEVIRRVATSVKRENIFHFRNSLAGLASDGMADSKPLAQLVAQYVTPELLAEIAREFEKGRVLEIGTTDLDAGRAVTWNMGAIASSRSPAALTLFRNIMIASASIPGAVSPVMIDVEVDGKPFQEMHVDGGVITQVFLYPSRIFPELAKATGTALRRQVYAYVIRNGRLEPEWSETRRRTLSVGGRAISALIETQGINDLDRIYETAQRDGVHINLAYIGTDFVAEPHARFDAAYMKRLFDYAYQAGMRGYLWHQTRRQTRMPPTSSPSCAIAVAIKRQQSPPRKWQNYVRRPIQPAIWSTC